MLRRRRRTVLIAALILMLAVLGVRLMGNGHADHADAAPTRSDTPPVEDTEPAEPATPTSEEPSPTPPVTEEGDGTFRYADVPADASYPIGDGDLMTYRVAVEEGISESPDEFAEFVDRVLRDERGWTAGDWSFEHVDEKSADFTIYLVSPQTRATLCGSEDTFSSCRNGDAVVVNLARWLKAVDHWDASLDDYRTYVVNHEIGHRLGEGHVVCPEADTPSPVMAQQTFSLRGCDPNPWPYVDGEYLTGPPGEYELIGGHYWDYVVASTGRTGHRAVGR